MSANEAAPENSTLPVPLCTVTSYSQDLPEQTHRSSGNFTTAWHPSDASFLTFHCPVGVSFDVKKDQLGSDPTVWTGVTDSQQVPFQSADNFYVANVNGTSQSFVIEVWVS